MSEARRRSRAARLYDNDTGEAVTTRGSSVSSPSFTATQRAELRKIGLVDAQITQLDSILRLIRGMIDPPATRTTVRGRLRGIERSLLQARGALALLVHPTTKDAVEVQTRLIDADDAPTAVLMDGDVARRTLGAIENALGATTRALKRLPRQQRRGSAFPLHAPIAKIDDALLLGFLKHHNPNYPSSADKPLPPYTLSNSSETFHVSRSSPFADIVRICCETVGVTTDIDRAIRQYLDQLAQAEVRMQARAQKLLAKHSTSDVSTGPLYRRRRGRPRKWTRASPTR